MVLILHQSNVRNKSYGLGKLVFSTHFEFLHYLSSSWCMCSVSQVWNWVIQTSLDFRKLGTSILFCSLVWEKQTSVCIFLRFHLYAIFYVCNFFFLEFSLQGPLKMNLFFTRFPKTYGSHNSQIGTTIWPKSKFEQSLPYLAKFHIRFGKLFGFSWYLVLFSLFTQDLGNTPLVLEGIVSLC